MPYRYLEGITSADVAFEATGKTPEEMFESAGLAITNTMVRAVTAVKPLVKKEIKKEADKIEKLLFDFLEELVYLKDAEQLLFSKFEIKIKDEKQLKQLTAAAYGEKINPKKHELIVDIKAVTYHKFEVKKTENGWKAIVIVDV
jgi:SHS2 domain-containing protein